MLSWQHRVLQQSQQLREAQSELFLQSSRHLKKEKKEANEHDTAKKEID
jgi:hypothetical protein